MGEFPHAQELTSSYIFANDRQAKVEETGVTRFLEASSRLVDVLLAAMLALMVVLVFGNVVLRYALNSGITVSEEVSRWLFVWMTFLGAIVALKDHAHLGTDMLVSRLPLWGKKLCLVVGHALMLWITVLLLQGAWAQARINWDVQAPVTGASMAIFYGAGVVFAIAAGFLLVRELILALSGRLSEDELVMVRESEEAAELEQILKQQAAVPGDIAKPATTAATTAAAATANPKP
jgi:TRAP-type C4-dicarboxylate transport system permease small subunit